LANHCVFSTKSTKVARKLQKKKEPPLIRTALEANNIMMTNGANIVKIFLKVNKNPTANYLQWGNKKI
jgi:hypothetical protein